MKKIDMFRNQQTFAQLAVLATAIIWSSGGVAVKLADTSPMALTGWRCIFCALLFLVVYRKEKLLTFSKDQWLGALAYAAMAFCFSAATKLTTAANAILLQYTAPVFVAILAGWLLNEKTQRKDWLTVLAVAVGVAVFFFDKASGGTLVGNMFGLLNGLTYALFIIYTRRQKEGNPAGSIFLGNIIAFAVSLPALIEAPLTVSGVAGGAYMGLIYGGVAYVLYTSAIRRVSALTVVLIATVEPVLNPVWVFFTVGEVPGVNSILGGGIVIGAVLVRSLLTLRSRSGS